MARGIDTKPYLEWLDGVESVAVSPNTPHFIVSAQLSLIFNREGGSFGFAGQEIHLRLNDTPGKRTMLLPDVAFFRNDTLLALDKADRLLPNVPPEIIVETRSPNDRKRFREEKIRRYLAWGCPLVLDVDPQGRAIIAHDENGTVTFMQAEHFDHPAVPWLRFEVREVFSKLDRFGF